MMAMRQILLGPRGAKPPYDAKVEYLESTGTQYLKTGVLFNSSDMEFRLTMALDNTLTGSWVDEFMGAMDSDSADNSSLRMRRYDNGNYIDVNFMNNPRACPGTGYSVAIRNVGYRTVVVRQFFAAVYDENGELIRSMTSAQMPTTPCGREVYLFCGNNAGSAFRLSTGMKVKEYVVLDNNVEVQHMIPVRIGSTAYGYDTISGNILENQGSGTFLYGNDVS